MLALDKKEQEIEYGVSINALAAKDDCPNNAIIIKKRIYKRAIAILINSESTHRF